jgi:hypothetical protein
VIDSDLDDLDEDVTVPVITSDLSPLEASGSLDLVKDVTHLAITSDLGLPVGSVGS